VCASSCSFSDLSELISVKSLIITNTVCLSVHTDRTGPLSHAHTHTHTHTIRSRRASLHVIRGHSEDTGVCFCFYRRVWIWLNNIKNPSYTQYTAQETLMYCGYGMFTDTSSRYEGLHNSMIKVLYETIKSGALTFDLNISIG